MEVHMLSEQEIGEKVEDEAASKKLRGIYKHNAQTVNIELK